MLNAFNLNCLGSCLVLAGDIWLHRERGNKTISRTTRPFIAIFIVNILLWIDFNITIVRRKNQHEPQTSRLRCATGLITWLTYFPHCFRLFPFFSLRNYPPCLSCSPPFCSIFLLFRLLPPFQASDPWNVNTVQ